MPYSTVSTGPKPMTRAVELVGCRTDQVNLDRALIGPERQHQPKERILGRLGHHAGGKDGHSVGGEGIKVR